jgi:hypothetical protein
MLDVVVMLPACVLEADAVPVIVCEPELVIDGVDELVVEADLDADKDSVEEAVCVPDLVPEGDPLLV